MEDDYEWYVGSTGATRICGGESGNCNINQGVTSTYIDDDTKLISAASTLQGRNIAINAGEDITLFGIRILAENDLDIASTHGSILIDSTDLDDEVLGAEFADVNFLELDGDAASLLFQDADLGAGF